MLWRSFMLRYVIGTLLIVTRLVPAAAQLGTEPLTTSVGVVTQITLADYYIQTTESNSSGPEASLQLRSDGTASYWGVKGVEKLGYYSGTFPIRDFARLSRLVLLHREQFQKNVYYSGFGGSGRGSKGTLSAIVNGQPLTTGFLRNDSHLGESSNSFNLWLMETAIRGVERSTNWQKVDLQNFTSGIRGTAFRDGKPLSEIPPSQVPDPNRRRLSNSLKKSVMVFLPGGSVPLIDQAITGKGEYALRLPPGYYMLRFSSSWYYRMAPPAPDVQDQLVEVKANQFVEVNVNYGSQDSLGREARR
jgi:hypothetical protein